MSSWHWLGQHIMPSMAIQWEERGQWKIGVLSLKSSSENQKVECYVKHNSSDILTNQEPMKRDKPQINIKQLTANEWILAFFMKCQCCSDHRSVIASTAVRVSGRVLLTRTLNLLYLSFLVTWSRWCLLVCWNWKCNISDWLSCHMQGNQCHFLAFYISRRRRHWHKSEHAQTDFIMFESNQRWEWNRLILEAGDKKTSDLWYRYKKCHKL